MNIEFNEIIGIYVDLSLIYFEIDRNEKKAKPNRKVKRKQNKTEQKKAKQNRKIKKKT